MEALCTRCGAAFSCGADDPATPCWCASLPPVALAADAAAGCLCPACLAAAALARGAAPEPPKG